MNLATLLVRAARLHPARMAVALGTAPVLDHAALARRTAALASGLRDRFGLATGEVEVTAAELTGIEAYATRAVERAIVNAVRSAESLADTPSVAEWRSGRGSKSQRR